MELLNTKYSFTLLVLILAFCMLQCNRSDEINTQVIPTPLEEYNNVSFLITVNGEENQQLQNSRLELDGLSTIIEADDNGILIVDNITILQSGIKAMLSAEGYENQTIRLIGAPNTVTSITVKLVKLTTKLIDTGDEGLISGDCILKLPSILEYANGNSFTGTVEVRSTYLDANDINILASTLGNMQALDNGGEYKMLGSLGMLKISFFDSSGNQLFFPKDITTQIKIPYDESQHIEQIFKFNAWSLDEDLAIWEKSGEVLLEDGMLVAELDKTSWINIGVSYYFYQSRMSFLDRNNREVPNLKVRLYADNVLFNEFYINDNNDVALSLPVAEELFLEYIYGNNSYEQSIGYFNGSEKMVDVILEDLSAFLVTGNALNCQVENIDSGYGIITNNEVSSAIGFKFGQLKYLNMIEDHIVKFVDKESSQSKTLAVNSVEDDIPLGEVIICEEDLASVSGYVFIDSDGDGAGDMPLSNQNIKLSTNAFEISRSTNSEGFYEFSFVQTDSIYLEIDLDEVQYAIFQSGDESPESGDEILGFEEGYPIRNLNLISDEDNNFIIINREDGFISGSYFGDVDEDGIGDVPLEWQEINTINENQIGYVNSSGDFEIERENEHGEIWIGFYAWVVDNDFSPDPDGDDSNLGPNGKIPYFIFTNENDRDNNIVIDLDFSAIVIQVLEDINGDGVGDIPVNEGEANIKHLVGGPASVISVVDLSKGRYVKDEFGMNLAELHEVTLSLPFDFEVLSIQDLSPDNDPAPVGDVMTVRTLGAEWDAGNTFTIRRI